MGTVRRWVLVGAAAGLVAVGAHEVHWALTVEPARDRAHIDAVKRLVDADRVDGQDQWAEYAAACERYGAARESVMERHGNGAPDVAPAGWPESAPWPVPLRVLKLEDVPAETRGLAQRMLADLCAPDIMAPLDGIAVPPRCVRPLDDRVARLIDIRFPELTSGREMGLACVASMGEALDAGDEAGVGVWYARALKAANIQSQQPTLIDRLVSDAVFDEATECACLVASRDGLDRATLDSMIASTRALADIPLPTRAMECERLSVLDTLRSLHDEDGRCIPARVEALTRESRGNDPQPPSPWMNLRWWRYPSLARTVRRAEEHFAVIAEAAASEPHARLAEPARLEAALETGAKPADRVLRLLLPALSHFVVKTDRSACARRATLVLLEIERFRAEHGRPPTTLAELAVSLPLDPYSGKDFGYFIPRPSADPRPYLLYTVGFDGADDEGSEGGDREAAFRRGQGLSGRDFVFNSKPSGSK